MTRPLAGSGESTEPAEGIQPAVCARSPDPCRRDQLLRRTLHCLLQPVCSQVIVATAIVTRWLLG